GAQSWIRGGYFLFGATATDAYSRLPNVDPPWLLALSHPWPQWLVFASYFATIGLVSTAGLIVGMLVRAKNRAADIGTGALARFIFGATVLITTLGWMIVVPVAVWPIQDDLDLLAEAAWAAPIQNRVSDKPVAQVRERAEARLLEKYPDMRAVPPAER